MGVRHHLPSPRAAGYREPVDATRRGELDELRRRVFGPDGTDDPETLDRLRALEDELHAESRQPAEPAGPVGSIPPAAPAHSPAVPAHSPAPPAPSAAPPVRDAGAPGWRRTVPTAVGAALIVILALALGGAFGRPPAITTHTVSASEARALAADEGAVMLQRIVVLGGSEAVPLPDGDRIPGFPTDGALQWAVLVAHSHGWRVWIAGADGERGAEHCLAAATEDAAWARCVRADRQDDEVLAVLTPPDQATGRGADGTEGERLGFWWSAAERVIYVLRASAPAG